jgi:hypothetical protein
MVEVRCDPSAYASGTNSAPQHLAVKRKAGPRVSALSTCSAARRCHLGSCHEFVGAIARLLSGSQGYMGLNTAAALQALRQRGKASLSDVEVKLLSRHKKNINTILRLSHQLTSLM